MSCFRWISLALAVIVGQPLVAQTAFGEGASSFDFAGVSQTVVGQNFAVIPDVMTFGSGPLPAK